ncbi:hypothetical protein JTB14_000625 [Gonioctena quinquepunctata]|nr:hypothetical protein JTB14_000625 [Gonioctena quinquepunctata]
MSCPFRRSSTSTQNGGAALKRSFTSRQNSFQVGPEEQEEEDKNTLNLKHLNEAILILTAPTLSIISTPSDTCLVGMQGRVLVSPAIKLFLSMTSQLAFVSTMGIKGIKSFLGMYCSDVSNDDFPLSRPVSAKQYFAENNHNIIIPNVGFPEDYITLEPSTSKIETVNKIQDNQNSENWDNISIKSSDLLASGSSAISKYNINPTDSPSCSNIAEYNYNNENVTNAIPIMSIGEEQNLSYHQLLPVVPENDNQEIITNSSTVDNVDSAFAVLLKTNDEGILHTTDGGILHIDNKETNTQENERIRAMNTTQNDEMNEENSVALKTYTKTGTIRKREKYDVPLKERKQSKIIEKREKHHVKTPCSSSCRLSCITNISEEQRKQLNHFFWSLNDEDRKYFMLHHTSSQPVKQRTVNESVPSNYKRQTTFFYFLKNSQGSSCKVCKTFFLTTLGYNAANDKPLETALGNIKDDSVSGPADKRCTNTPHNKIDDGPIKEHIFSFEPSISHYRREHTPNRFYLPSDLSITHLHTDFVEKNPSMICSYDKYRKVLPDLNISFVKLGHEECEECEEFDSHDKTHNKNNIKKDCECCTRWASHIERAERSREQYQYDTDLTKTDTIVYSAYLEKVIMIPRIDMFKSTVFTHRIVVYNGSFVPTGARKGSKASSIYPVLWQEALSGRSKHEILSAYYHFFVFHRDMKNIVLWVDNCSAQNKNWTFFSFLIYIINSDQINADKIIVKYFEAGHTFMSADSFHHRVELAMKRMKNKIYDFDDFCEAVSSAGKNVNTKKMTVDDFYEWQDYTTQYQLSRLSSRPYISEIVEVEVSRGSFDISYKTGSDNEPITASIIGAKFLKLDKLPPPTKKTVPAGISQTKKKKFKILFPV